MKDKLKSSQNEEARKKWKKNNNNGSQFLPRGEWTTTE